MNWRRSRGVRTLNIGWCCDCMLQVRLEERARLELAVTVYEGHAVCTDHFNTRTQQMVNALMAPVRA